MLDLRDKNNVHDPATKHTGVLSDGITCAARALSYTLRRLGFKALAWNIEYASGRWQADNAPRSSTVISKVVEALARFEQPTLLEIGCGEGSLPLQLPKGAFAQYIGIDISALAISRAKQRFSNQSSGNVQFACSDAAKYSIPRRVDVVLAEECIYYMSPDDIANVLKKCSNALSADGVIIIVVHNPDKHAEALESCRKTLPVAEEYMERHRRVCVLKTATGGRVA